LHPTQDKVRFFHEYIKSTTQDVQQLKLFTEKFLGIFIFSEYHISVDQLQFVNFTLQEFVVLFVVIVILLSFGIISKFQESDFQRSESFLVFSISVKISFLYCNRYCLSIHLLKSKLLIDNASIQIIAITTSNSIRENQKLFFFIKKFAK